MPDPAPDAECPIDRAHAGWDYQQLVEDYHARGTEIERLRAEVAELQEIRKVAGAALRCALSPDSDRIARDGFTESALAYLAGYGGDWNAMQAAEKGRARGH